jgi:carboxylesterase
LGLGNLAREFMKNDADNPHINYLLCPVSAFVQVKTLMKKVRQSLPEITIPALVLQAKNDPKVAPGSGPAIFKLLGTDKKHFAWIDYHMHGIVRGEIAKEVFKEVESFLATYSLINPSK